MLHKLQKFFILICVVSLLLSCIYVSEPLAAVDFAVPKRVVSKIVAVSKASPWWQKALNTVMVVVGCAHMLSCGDWEQEVRDTIYNNAATGLPIMQGATTADQTQLLVLSAQGDDYVYSLRDEAGNAIHPATVDKGGRQGFEPEIQRVSFRGLQPSSHYLLQVHTEEGTLLDERDLRTLDPSKQELRFTFGACMADYIAQKDIWQQMVALDPDVIFLIGDNVYTNTRAPTPSPDFMWQRYYKTRISLNLFRSRQLIPVISVWDDNDYGRKGGNLTYPHKEELLTIFKTFFASDTTDNFYMPDIGAASFFSIYGYNFFLLDNRSFRTPKGLTPEWHFGEEQSQWLLDNLGGKDYAFIISGDQFFGGHMPHDSFQGHHPKRFGDFLGELKASGTKAVFLSGDRHYTEIMKIPAELLGYQTYEFTSGSIHSTRSKLPPHNPLRVVGKGSVNNFMLIEASKLGTGLRLQATSYTFGGEVLFTSEHTVD